MLALLTAEADLVREVRGVRPVLLLDDVASELDRGRAQSLLGLLRAARPGARDGDGHPSARRGLRSRDPSSTTAARIRDDAGVSGLEDIGAILGRALGGSVPDARLAAVCSAWRAAAGPLADEVWPARFARDGGLILNCTSAVLAGDLDDARAGAARAAAGAGLRPACAALPRGPRAGCCRGLTTGRIASIHPGSPRIKRNFGTVA